MSTYTVEPPPLPEKKEVLSRPHINHIDGLRGFAALFVVCAHLMGRAWFVEGVGSPQSPLSRTWAKISPMSHFAVSAFIILSGYCLMLPMLKSELRFVAGVGNYFQRRFLRIAPPFYVAFVLSCLLGLYLPKPEASYSELVSLKNIFAHLFFLNNVIPYGGLWFNGVLWSVGVEWWIYFWLPAFLFLWRRFKNGTILTVSCVVFFYALFYLARNTPFAGFRFDYFGLFCLGCLCADWTHGTGKVAIERIPTKFWLVLTCVMFVLTFGTIGVLRWKVVEPHVELLDLLFSFYFCSLLIFLVQSPSFLLTRLLSHSWIYKLGLFSYSLYLIHFPLQSIFVRLVYPLIPASESWRAASLIFICLPIICGLSYLFHLAVELPSIRLSQSLKKKSLEKLV